LQLKRVAIECAEWIEDKVDIRSIRESNMLHGKMYHIAKNGVENAILGSSNFTVRGLGLSEAGGNIELNLKVADDRDRNDLKLWFDELWNDDKRVADVKDEVLSYLRQLYENYAPEFVYYKTLYHLFERYLSDQEGWGLLDTPPQLVDTQIWNALYGFQKDGVKGAINKILTHNGCIIADSVGLGKTYEALAVIKYFELRNENVLVLCPKKLRENWTLYPAYTGSTLNPFPNDRFGYTVLSHTDLSRASGMSGDVDLSSFNWGNYGLVVIDESHNFRNNTYGARDEQDKPIRRTRYERLMEDIVKSGVNTKILLLSATPVNNDLRDLRNQLYLLTEGRDDAFKDSLGITNLKETITSAQTAFNKWSKQDGTRSSQNLLDELSTHFFRLLDGLTIARSRKQIQKYYPDSMRELGGFPNRGKPESIYTKIDREDEFLPYDALNDEISEYQLSVYNPTKYLRPEFESIYNLPRVPHFTQRDREHYLIGMMRVNFLKRLESSVHSFKITLERTLTKIDRLEDRIRRFQKYRVENPEVDLTEMPPDADGDEELQAALEVGKSLKFKMAHLDYELWLEDLGRDREQLERPLRYAEKVSPPRDAKLAAIKGLIREKVKNPTTTKRGTLNRKVLVFTAFADTADYLYEALHGWAQAELGVHIGLVTGGAMPNRTTLGKTNFVDILTNFSPVAKNRGSDRTMPQDEEIDLLIGTDCISEGQNLQDCDYLINYDIHWNPVRIIQRFGRIDRIGSVN
ncbi:MAG: helicase-related protein, partial [Candidatus Poribacteria bacterium]|nr:helicase-related protein [Candidatus Poribacteria bacterium]